MRVEKLRARSREANYGIKSQFHHLLVVRIQPRFLNSPCLSFLSYKNGMIILELLAENTS